MKSASISINNQRQYNNGSNYNTKPNLNPYTSSSNQMPNTNNSNQNVKNSALNNSSNMAQNSSNNSQTKENTTDSSKIKTPMCLINELSRSHKVEHKYILEDEKGPAHKKVFTIRLKIGDEEYVGEDSSIKKAQHASATKALQNTKYRFQPKQKDNQANNSKFSDNKCITPTVELNGLVMKRGQPVTYTIIEKPKQVFYPRMENQQMMPKFHRQANSEKQLFTIRLNVGMRQYIGQGGTVKAARNHAAEQALQELATIPYNKLSKPIGEEEKDDAGKTVIMQVHEIIHKRKLNIKFEMLRETGPSHLRIYVMQCSSGDMKAEGEGRSKKAAKNSAAENLLPQLLKLPPLETAEISEKPKKVVKARRKKALNKMSSLNPEYGSNMNPSSRLLQIQQAKKKKVPTATLR